MKSVDKDGSRCGRKCGWKRGEEGKESFFLAALEVLALSVFFFLFFFDVVTQSQRPSVARFQAQVPGTA